MAARLGWVDAVAGAPSFVGQALRQFFGIGFQMGASTRPLGALSGVRPGTPSTTVTATTTTWTVNPFSGVIDGEAAAIAGPYPFSFDTAQTGSMTAAGGTARIDALDVQVSDPSQSDGTSTPGIAIVYAVGTATAPALTARSFRLCTINVPASGGGSPTVNWTPSYSVAAGGVLPCATYALLPTVGLPGMMAEVIADPVATNNGLYWWNAAASTPAWWKVAPLIQAASGKTSAMPATAQPIIQTGRVSAVTGASGVLPNFTFPFAFPNGVASLQLTAGNGSSVAPVLNSDSLTTALFQAVVPGTASGQTVVYYFTAIGW